MELVDMETYASWSPQARSEFDLWLRNETGLEVGLVHCFEVVIAESFIVTKHYLNFGKGVASRDGRALWFRQIFLRDLGVWDRGYYITLHSEA